KGSVFAIEVPLGEEEDKAKAKAKASESPASGFAPRSDRRETLLLIEDDPTVREALQLLFNGEGYHTIAATDGIEVAALAQRGALMPDAIIADYNLPGGRTGLQVIGDLRRSLN